MNLRIKTHVFPGSVGKKTREALLERRHPECKRSKRYRQMVFTKTRAVLKERTDVHIQNEGL